MHFGAGRDLVVGIQEFYFKYAWFEIPTKYASGSVQEAVGYVSLDLRRVCIQRYSWELSSVRGMNWMGSSREGV